MKKIAILIISLLLLSGCSNKFKGTWCLYSEISTSLVILNDDVTSEQINLINQYIKSLKDVRSFDLVDNIEEANKMINIYYMDKTNVESYENRLRTYKGVKRVENKILNQAKEKLVLSKDSYVYGINLNTEYSTETNGTYRIEEDTVILDHKNEFYFKNRFLCKDKDCNVIFTKSNKKSCD